MMRVFVVLVLLQACAKGPGSPCTATSECSGTAFCSRAGVCTGQGAACMSDQQCAPQQVCANSLCLDVLTGLPGDTSSMMSTAALPTANAGADQSVATGQWVKLDGSASSDSMARTLTYAWTQTAGPTVVLLDGEGAAPRVQLNVSGTYTFDLAVTAGSSTSAIDSVTITASPFTGSPAQPPLESLRGRLVLPGSATDVSVYAGTHAYVAALTAGVRVIDVSNPESPTLVRTIATTGTALRVRVDGSYLYVAAQTAGVRIYSLSDPSNPSLAGTFAPSGAGSYMNAVATTGNTMFTSDLYGGITLVDISNKASPVPRSNFDAAGNWFDVDFADGSLVAVLENAPSGYVHKFTPTGLGTPGAALGGSTMYPAAAYNNRVKVSGTHAYVTPDTAGPMLRDYDLTQAAGVSGTPYFLGSSEGAGITMYQGVPLVVSSEGLFGIDFTRPAANRIVARYPIEQGTPSSVAIYGTRAYVTCGTEGLLILELAGLVAPPKASFDGHRQDGRSIHLLGNRAYVTSEGPSGARAEVYDVANPRQPALLGGGAISPYLNNSTAASGYLYVTEDSRFEVVSMGNPAAISVSGFLLGEYVTPAVLGNYVYMQDVDDNILITDVSVPSTPTVRGFASVPDVDAGLVASPPNLLALQGTAGVALWAPSGPSGFKVQSTLNTPGEAVDAVISGTTAYVADGTQGLRIVNMANLSEVGFYSSTGSASAVAVDATTVVIRDSVLGLSLIDVSDAARPRLLSFLDAELGRFVVRDGAAIVAVRSQGLFAYDLVTQGSMQLQPNSTIARGGVALYTYTWDDAFPATDEKVFCRVGAGSCVLTDVNQASHTATVRWNLPSSAGDFELAVSSGNALRGEVRRATVRLP